LQLAATANQPPRCPTSWQLVVVVERGVWLAKILPATTADKLAALSLPTFFVMA